MLNKVRSGLSKIAAAVSLMVVCVVGAFAQTPPTLDWAEQATTIKDSLTSQIVAVFPILLGVMALFIGIAVFKRMTRGFAK